MRNVTGWVVALLVAAGAIAPVGAAPMVTPEARPQAATGPGAYAAVPAPKGRLKFKSAGPVCMCGEGMSERDIEHALAKSAAEKIAGQESGTSQTPVGGQEKNLNLGVAK